jgi:hypothetical protein
MAVQPSKGFCKIKFFNALALAFSIAGICPALLTAQSVGKSMVAADSGVQAPIFNDNLPNQDTADDRDRLRDLYSGSELDTYTKEPENNTPEFDPTQSEAETLAQLPHRGENRQEIPIPNPLQPNLPKLAEPAPPAPLPPPEQLLPPAVPVPAQPAELPNIPGTIKVDRFEVVGSTVFSKQELDGALEDFVGRPLTFAQAASSFCCDPTLHQQSLYHIWSADWAANAHSLSCEDISARRHARKYKYSRD